MSLTVTCFDDLDRCDVSEREWDDFLIGARAEVFHSFRWIRIWLAHYGGGRTLRLFVIRNGDMLVGLLPLFYEDYAWVALGSRVAKLVCADFGIASLSLPIRPEVLRPALDDVLQQLFERDGCDAVQFGAIVSDPESLNVMRGVARRRGLPSPQELPGGFESVLQLPDTFEAYLSSLSKNTQKNFRRTWNRLSRDFECDAQVISRADEVETVFEDFARMHTQQWQEIGHSGHFNDWPGSREFHASLIKALSPKDQLLLFVLKANGEPTSYRYCYGLGDRLFSLLPARLTGVEWLPYGLGRLNFIMMVKAAIERGYREIDLGGAYWEHKKDLGGEERPSTSIFIYRSRASQVRCQWLRMYAMAVDLLYYKIWFKRIAPRIGWRRGPLWAHWIRLASFAGYRKRPLPAVEKNLPHVPAGKGSALTQ